MVNNKNAKVLAQLMSDNPELKVVAKVDEEIVADDGHSWWLGAVGNAEITGMYIDDERVWFEDEKDDLVERAFEEIYDSVEKELGKANINDQIVSKLADKTVSELNWEKVIAVSVTVHVD